MKILALFSETRHLIRIFICLFLQNKYLKISNLIVIDTALICDYVEK